MNEAERIAEEQIKECRQMVDLNFRMRNVMEDADLIAEIQRRSAEIDSGAVTGIPWCEMRQKARKTVFGEESIKRKPKRC